MATFSYGPYYQSSIQAKEKQRKALTGQGYTSEELAGLNYGELMARYQDAEARRTREENKAIQEKGLALQEKGLESQIGFQGIQTRIQEKAQKSAERAATISGIATGVNVLDKIGVLSWGGKAITSGFAPAAEATTTYGVSELPEAAGWGEEGAGFFTSAYNTVSNVIKSGTVICTELYNQGLLDEETYRADSRFGSLLSEDILVGYRVWAIPIVRLMRKSSLFTKIVSLFAIPWAKEMAFRMGVKEKGNVFGKAMLFIGIPICRTIGRALMARGGRLQWLF